MPSRESRRPVASDLLYEVSWLGCKAVGAVTGPAPKIFNTLKQGPVRGGSSGV